MGSSKLGRRDEEIKNLVLKLQTLLPQLNRRKLAGDNSTVMNVSAGEVLKETCDYIKKLQGEVDDLSERLWKHLDSMDGVHFDMLKHLLLTF